MRYLSTRGEATADFHSVLLSGLAADGGLFVPQSLPCYTAAEMSSWQDWSYARLACRLLEDFVGDCFSRPALQAMLEDAWRQFRHPAVAPLIQLSPRLWLLELFHGPTLAFKDFALQLLGRMLDQALAVTGDHGVVLGATSGDTGAAAIQACMGCRNLDIFMLHPQGRVAPLQRLQMTTVEAPNVHNLAVDGSFDDCQRLIKSCFLATPFLPERNRLLAVNSINWVRIMAQTVYYFYAALALGAPARSVTFTVPSGNFGNMYAAWLCRRMGLPVHRLLVATNHNDVLHRFVQTGRYRCSPPQQTLSPSMDIVVASNLERLMHDLLDGDARAVKRCMQQLPDQEMELPGEALKRLQEVFSSGRCDDPGICAEIRRTYEETGYLLDPHTAVGVAAARRMVAMEAPPVISLATAHPAKFPEAIGKAGCPPAPVPKPLRGLEKRPEHCLRLPPELTALQDCMVQRLRQPAA